MVTSHEQIIQIEDWLEKMSDRLSIKYIATAFSSGKEITEDRLKCLLQKIREGENQGIYLSQDSNLEGDYMQMEVDNGWIFLQYVKDTGTQEECFYSSFNSNYLGSEEEWPIKCSDGQSIILTRYTMHDLDLAAKCVEYFVRTGKLYPMAWLKC